MSAASRSLFLASCQQCHDFCWSLCVSSVLTSFVASCRQRPDFYLSLYVSSVWTSILALCQQRPDFLDDLCRQRPVSFSSFCCGQRPMLVSSLPSRQGSVFGSSLCAMRGVHSFLWYPRRECYWDLALVLRLRLRVVCSGCPSLLTQMVRSVSAMQWVTSWEQSFLCGIADGVAANPSILAATFNADADAMKRCGRSMYVDRNAGRPSHHSPSRTCAAYMLMRRRLLP
jgi:hypothetical protein